MAMPTTSFQHGLQVFQVGCPLAWRRWLCAVEAAAKAPCALGTPPCGCAHDPGLDRQAHELTRRVASLLQVGLGRVAATAERAAPTVTAHAHGCVGYHEVVQLSGPANQHEDRAGHLVQPQRAHVRLCDARRHHVLRIHPLAVDSHSKPPQLVPQVHWRHDFHPVARSGRRAAVSGH